LIRKNVFKGGMGNQQNVIPALQLIKGGLINKKSYKRERPILLDKIKKGDTTIYLLRKKRHTIDLNEVEKYKIPIGYYGEINPTNLRIVATKKTDSCRIYYLC